MSKWWYIGGALLLLLLARPAAAAVNVATGSDLLAACAKKLSDRQRANAQVIIDQYRAQFLPDNLIAAAIVNAYAESALDESAQGDGGHSIGLFMLNDVGYSDLSVETRMDPAYNTKALLDREVTGKAGATLRSRAYDGAGAAELARIFCRDIERPASPAQSAAREDLAKKMFPTLG